MRIQQPVDRKEGWRCTDDNPRGNVNENTNPYFGCECVVAYLETREISEGIDAYRLAWVRSVRDVNRVIDYNESVEEGVATGGEGRRVSKVTTDVGMRRRKESAVCGYLRIPTAIDGEEMNQ